MTDAYQPSPLGGVAYTPGAQVTPATLPAGPPKGGTGPYAPSDINSALIRAGAPPSVAPTLTAITGAESGFGRSPVSPPNKDGSRDYSLGQINSKAWPQLNPPGLVHAPLDQQAAAIVHVYNNQGLGAWTTYKNGAYKKYLGQVGSTTVPAGGPTPTSAPVATPADASVGAALAALNGPGSNVDLKPALNDLNKIANPDQTQMARPDGSGLQLQQAANAGGNARSAQIAMQASQLAAALRQQGAQPLIWSSQPFGSTAGQQRTPTTMTSAGGQMVVTPGTTLNSTSYGYV